MIPKTVLEDVDECGEMTLICTHGKCTNTFGSFICACDPGYRLDISKAMCVGKSCSKSQKDFLEIVSVGLRIFCFRSQRVY
jgi:hypothetical protein